MSLLSLSSKTCPAIVSFADMPHCHWCNGKDVCYDVNEFLGENGYYDPEEKDYQDNQYHYLMQDFAEDACAG